MRKGLIPQTVLTDTGFWFAVYNHKDQYHLPALKILPYVQEARLLLPRPILYEVLNTRFVKNKIWVKQFEKLLKKQNVHRLDDAQYKELATNETFGKSLSHNWNLSLTDSVIRQILTDPMLNIDYFVTFNSKDFHDIIRKSNIQLLDEHAQL